MGRSRIDFQTVRVCKSKLASVRLHRWPLDLNVGLTVVDTGDRSTCYLNPRQIDALVRHLRRAKQTILQARKARKAAGI